MIVAVASGKGGTGKTTVATNLARVHGAGVQLLDCDVEAPNSRLFLPGEVTREAVVSVPVPRVDEARCQACGACSRFCRFHAIVGLGTAPLVFPELCHGCGGCALVCPHGAIGEVDHPIGTMTTVRGDGYELVEGRLDVGVAMAPPLIRAVRARGRRDGLTILDAPPGTTCPVVATLRGSDVVVLVTEPTPFGLHDLTLAVDLVRTLGLPHGVVINRADAGDGRVDDFCRRERVPILARIPDDRRIAAACARGELLVETIPSYVAGFGALLERIGTLAGADGPRRVAS
jgi:MinD superfamily P-loop ATPase